MTSFKSYDSRHFDGFKVLRIPYKSGVFGCRRLSMYFFLPDKRYGLQSPLEKLSSSSEFSKVSVTKMFQKAGIEVDKKGTEARAAIATMAATYLARTPKIES
ncbi:serpin-Z1-like [Actinidia eriantha]|uniref:serpin-Z1-like n=1 Tax=Actinidia eriantha TaxID=165200 RepID=UPI00258B9EF7|nr:serpin-Z1-like [Actinidia eriantha]